MSSAKFHLVPTALLTLLLPHAAHASDPARDSPPHTRCVGAPEAGTWTPTPADPYPLMAAGWGPELGGGMMASRWVEDWSGVKAAGHAPALKAIPLGGTARLSLSSEVRLRYATWNNAQLVRANDMHQAQLRAVIGADLRLDPHVRVFGELGTGQVDRRQDSAAANFQNDLSLQQLFVDIRAAAGETLAGAIIGRQEFSDGPRQLISLSDGPDLHRSWNGVRFYLHGARHRIGVFDLRATRLGRNGFDETVDHRETLQGFTASFVVSPGEGPNTYLEPFWFHTRNPAGRTAGLDDRNTFGARLWGRIGKARFDWTAARQTGRAIDGRSVDAWGLFAVQSLELSDTGWKPRLTSHIDLATGGADDTGSVQDFNPLYASSNYLGESQFLGLTNLLLFAPGVALAPTARTTLSFEYAYARRLQESDAVYGGGMRPYVGTEAIAGQSIGGLARLSGTWSATPNLSLSLNFEHLDAGTVLERAGYASGSYGYLSATYRY